MQKETVLGGRKLSLAVCLVALATGATLPAATVTTEGTVLTIDVDAGESYTNSTALASPITEVVKTGAGTAVFTAAAPDFAGTINVNAGTAQFTVRDAYGAGPINVADGAAMVVSHDFAGQTTVCVRGTVTIAGAGPDGSGALRFTGAGNADQIFQKVTLSANATWGGTRCGARTVDFGGHELTWSGASLMAFSSHWQNFGGLVHRGSSTITFQASPTFDASCTNGLITLASSGGISFWALSVKIPFSLKVEGSAGIAANSGSGEWTGPIEVASGGELQLSTGSSGRTLTVSGAVTGEGAMRLTGTSSIVLSGGANSIAGDLVATNGTVTLNIPGDSSLEVAGSLRGNAILKKTGAGRLLVHSASPGFTGSIDAVTGLVAFDGTQAETLPNAASLKNVSFMQGGVVSVGCAYTAADYVPDGLVLHYDGIENAGPRLCDLSASIATWKNLAASGSAYDLPLPSFVTPRMNSFLSGVASSNTKTGLFPTIDTVPGISNTGTGPITLEVVMYNAGWRYTDDYNNLQAVVGTPYGTVGYRYNSWDGHYFQTLANSSQTHLYNLWLGLSAATLHTYSAQLGVGVADFWVDGTSMKGKSEWGKNNYKANRRTNWAFFSNPRADIRVYAIRVYNRALTANERAANRALDALRFQGTALPASLLLATADIPSQTWDGVHDVCPRPVVSNLITRAQLAQGRDYALVYAANAAPGTGSVKVVGLGDYAGQSVTKNFAIARGFTAELAAGADGVAAATLAFPASDRAHALYVAGGDRDAGGLTNGWNAVVRLADVPAGATSLAGVALPAASSGWLHMRFFLSAPATSDGYVTDGLVLHLDGIDNTLADGVRAHDADAAVLSDLTGNGNDVAVPSFATVTDNAVVSAARTDKSTAGLVPELDAMAGVDAAPSRLTVEMTAKRGTWRYADNYGNLQTVMTTPLGYVSYRDNHNAGFGVAYRDRNGNNLGQRYYSWRPGVLASDLHTTAARLEVGGASFAIDGRVSYGTFTSHWYENISMSSEYRFFSNLRADITAHAIRLYNRKLTEEELARNARLDALRFGGGGDVLAASACLNNPCAVAAKVRGAPGGAVADLAYAPLDADRSLYVAWGAQDGGATTGGWANVARVATLAAGTASARVTLPAAAVPSPAGRFFILEDAYGSSSYVTNGLVLQYDGVDNTLADGVRSHDAAATVWSDLTGRGHDVALPACVTVEANAMFSAADTGKASVSVDVPEATTGATHVVTMEVAVQRGAWTYTDNYDNLQPAFMVPFGSVGFRKAGWIFVQHPTDAATLSLSQFKEYSATITNPRTLAATLGIDDSGARIDGAAHALGVNDSYTTGFGSACKLFGNLRANLRLFAVRLYNRKLSDAELKWNARVDAGRFLGAPAFSVSEPMSLYPPGFMIILR